MFAEKATFFDVPHRGAQTRPTRRQTEGRLEIWAEDTRQHFASRLEDPKGRILHALWQPPPGNAYLYNAVRGGAIVRVAHQAGRASLAVLMASTPMLDRFQAAFLAWLEQRHWRALSLAAFVSEDGASLQLDRSDPARARIIAERRHGAVLLRYTLMVDPRSFAPREARLEWEIGEAAFQLELSAPQLSPAGPVSYEPVLPRPEPRVPTAVPLSEAAPSLAEWRVRAAFALHEVQACLDEPVELTADDQKLQLRSVVNTAARREAIAHALSDVVAAGVLEVDVETVAQAMRNSSNPAGQGEAAAPLAAGAPSPELLRYFGTGAAAAEALHSFASGATTRSEEVLAHAGALAQLARDFGHPGAMPATPESWRLLFAMIDQHVEAFRRATAAVQAYAGPGLARMAEQDAVPPTGRVAQEAWAAAAARLADAGLAFSKSLAFLAGGPAAHSPREMAREALRALDALDAAVARSRAPWRSIPEVLRRVEPAERRQSCG